MKELFVIKVTVDTPIVVGQDNVSGRRQLIPITGGELTGFDLEGNPVSFGVGRSYIAVVPEESPVDFS